MIKSEKEIRKIINNVNATLAFEGLKASKDATDASERILRGELSGDEARSIIMNKYNLVTK